MVTSDNSRNSDRTCVQPNTLCQLSLDENSPKNIDGILENISKRGACVLLQKNNKCEISEDVTGRLVVDKLIDIRITVIWCLYGRLGIMFDREISIDIIEYYTI